MELLIAIVVIVLRLLSDWGQKMIAKEEVEKYRTEKEQRNGKAK